VSEYAIPSQIASKVYFTGYFPWKIPSVQGCQCLRRSIGHTGGKKFVLVTAGGGGDGYKIFDTYLTMLESKPHCVFKSMIITGPLLADDLYNHLAIRARKLKMRIVKFYRKMEKAILAADCVVSMGGYNTMCEIISAVRPSLIIPRSTPRGDQLIRARLFAAQGFSEFIPWETVNARSMREKINLLLAQALEYEAQLRKFPMTAFDVINSRIQAFSNSRFHRQATLSGHETTPV